jgi:N-acetyl sugar amidotransferase
MDTSDPEISFDEQGVCSHCTTFDRVTSKGWHPNANGRQMLMRKVEFIKTQTRRNEYDCVIGLSGGIDSSYLALIARRELGLRLLAVHVDSGWNSELAVRNIENICRRLDVDLHTRVLDWEEICDLQRAFLRAGIANLDVPQDHAFTAALYREAARFGVKYLLSGGNIATESVLPRAWGYSALDLRHLKSVHARHGTRRLREFPTLNFWQYYVYYPYVRGIRSVRPLNFLPYDKEAAVATLQRELDFCPYGTKHGESRFTKFFQNYYLPTRFGYDKRKAHFSSLILAGQTTRDRALGQLRTPLYEDAELRDDQRYFLKKLGISAAEFNDIMTQPLCDHHSFASNEWLFKAKDVLKPLLARLGKGLPS